MSKINLDKYYTSDELAGYCVDKAVDIIGKHNISCYLEPSAGEGVFLKYLDKLVVAYDIDPMSSGIITQDYLSLEPEYIKGRCVIGNPPFGTRNTLSVKFYKHSIKFGDYIAFILPVSQYNNNQQMYEFDLIHSEVLPLVEYSNRKLLCCFNVYRRPETLNRRGTNYKLSDVEILEWRRGGTYKIPVAYDYGMCSWGTPLGKGIDHQGQYALENYIIVHNKAYKNKVIDVLKNANWSELYPAIASPRLAQWKIYKHLKEQIPELK